MRKIHRVQSTLLIIALAIVFPIPTSVTLAKTQRLSQGFSWMTIEDLLGRQKSRKGGSR